jgi:hypothetical protein
VLGKTRKTQHKQSKKQNAKTQQLTINTAAKIATSEAPSKQKECTVCHKPYIKFGAKSGMHDPGGKTCQSNLLKYLSLSK